MTKKAEIRHLHALLQHKNRWYIDPQCPDMDMFQTLAEIAKEDADEELSNISVQSLYQRFLKWEKDANKIVSPQEDYYHSFLDDLVWNIGLNAFSGHERELYSESINLTIKFI